MADVKLDKRLNLVMPIVRSDGSTFYVHSTPIGQEVYEANYSLLTKTISTLYADEYPPVGCARVAWLRIKDIAAKEPARYDGAEAFFQEMWRLTVVLQPGANGWEQRPFIDYLPGGNSVNDGIAARDIQEVCNGIVFFTAASWFHNTKELEDFYKMIRASGARTTSLQPMAYAASLPTSKPKETTGEKAPA